MLYMNEPKRKTDEMNEQDDLFTYSDGAQTSSPAEETLADTQPPCEPEGDGATPETLPLIQETLVPPKQEPPRQVPPKKAPLIFSARAPIPSRGGINSREEDEARRKRIVEQAAREIPPLTLDQVPTDLSCGALLKLARENAAYTADAVAEITRISRVYITALENDELNELPPYIYQTAYLRVMCQLYKLPEETAQFVMKLHSNSHDSYESHSRQQDFPGFSATPEDRRANWIFTGIVVAIGVLILLGVWAMIIALVKYNGEKEAYSAPQTVSAPAVHPTAKPVKFDQQKLEKLSPERMLDLRLLEMGNTGKVRD